MSDDTVEPRRYRGGLLQFVEQEAEARRRRRGKKPRVVEVVVEPDDPPMDEPPPPTPATLLQRLEWDALADRVEAMFPETAWSRRQKAKRRRAGLPEPVPAWIYLVPTRPEWVPAWARDALEWIQANPQPQDILAGLPAALREHIITQKEATQ